MGLDIRWPIGFIFTLYGAILIFHGLFTTPRSVEAGAGININAWWGAAMLVFGLFMGALAYRALRRGRP